MRQPGRIGLRALWKSIHPVRVHLEGRGSHFSRREEEENFCYHFSFSFLWVQLQPRKGALRIREVLPPRPVLGATQWVALWLAAVLTFPRPSVGTCKFFWGTRHTYNISSGEISMIWGYFAFHARILSLMSPQTIYPGRKFISGTNWLHPGEMDDALNSVCTQSKDSTLFGQWMNEKSSSLGQNLVWLKTLSTSVTILSALTTSTPEKKEFPESSATIPVSYHVFIYSTFTERTVNACRRIVKDGWWESKYYTHNKNT